MDEWERFSQDYDATVYSVTSFPIRREQLLSRTAGGTVLNMGCGSMPYLNQDLLDAGNEVIASDLSPAMIHAASKALTHRRLRYLISDSRSLGVKDESVSTVIVVNSILPEKRRDVQPMFDEIRRVLRPGGSLVGFFPSFASDLRIARTLGIDLPLDYEQLRSFDTTGWQCFHAPWTLEENLQAAGFTDASCDTVEFGTEEELAAIRRIYGLDIAPCPVFEYLVVARR